MTTPFPVIITDAGRAAIIALGGTAQTQIASVGFTASGFQATPGMTALPGNVHRIATIAGLATDETTIHVTVQDDSQNGYGVAGFGVFLADGTLLAAYGEADAIVTKASETVLLLALDLELDADIVSSVTFGSASFTYPAATETVPGVAPFATSDEVFALAEPRKTVSPGALGRLMGLFARLTGGVFSGDIAFDQNGDHNLVWQRPGMHFYGNAESLGLYDDRNGQVVYYYLTGPKTFNVAAATNFGAGLQRGGQDVLTVDQICSDDDTTAGGITNRPVSPHGVAAVINRLIDGADGALNTLGKLASAISALRGRRITGSGLATGGGDLNSDQQITVMACGDDDARAGQRTDVVLTPHSGDLLMRERMRYAYEVRTNAGQDQVTVPDWAHFADIEIIGGGGAGGGGVAPHGSDPGYAGGGGGAGGYAKGRISVTPGQQITRIVGAGGAGNPNVGGNGGQSSLSGIGSADGGQGGGSSAATCAGGPGGASRGLPLCFNGGGGADGDAISALVSGGQGASGPFGGGGRAGAGAGIPGSNPGSAGGGAWVSTGNGGNGADGAVIIIWRAA